MDFRKMAVTMNIPGFTRIFKNEIIIIDFENIHIIDNNESTVCTVKYNETAANVIISNSKRLKIT